MKANVKILMSEIEEVNLANHIETALTDTSYGTGTIARCFAELIEVLAEKGILDE